MWGAPNFYVAIKRDVVNSTKFENKENSLKQCCALNLWYLYDIFLFGGSQEFTFEVFFYEKKTNFLSFY